MADDLHAVEEWIGGLLARLSPDERRQVNRLVAMDLRRSQRERIASQRNPDGTAYTPRRPSKNLRGKSGQIKRRTMFAKLRTARYLKIQHNEDEILVGFTGRAAVIASAHQRGQRRTAPGGRTFTTPQRRLLGLTDTELEFIRDAYLKHMAAI